MSGGRILRLGCATTILVLLALAVGGWWAWDRAQAAPTWYAPPDPAAPAVTALAETVEYRLVEEAQRIRPAEDDWTLRVREEQVNAWLATRLPEWLRHEQDTTWPEGLGTPQVRIVDGTVAMAIEVRTAPEARPQVVVARLRPELAEAGLRLRLESVGLGRLMLPGAAVGRLAAALDGARAGANGGADGDAIAALIDLLARDAPFVPRFELADGRAIELRGLALHDGAIDVRSRTLGPAAARGTDDGGAR